MGAVGFDVRAAIVAEARGWLGTRFRHQGRSREGVDCAGLVICVGRELGLLPADFDVTGYSRLPDGVSLLKACDAHLVRITPAQMGVGDVAVFRIERDPQHLAIVGDYFGGNLSMVHAYAPAHQVTENGLGPWWRARMVAVYRLPGVV